MKKYLGFVVFMGLVLSLGFVSAVRAESDENEVEIEDEKTDETKETFKLEREEKRDEFKKEREEKKEELKKEKEVFKEGIKTEREAFKEKVKEEKESFDDKTKEERDVLREKLKAERDVLKEKIKTEREAFTEKLKTEREAFLAELKTRKEEWKNTRSDKKAEFCEKAREAFSTKFTEAISKLEGFQVRVSEVVAKLKADGRDTTASEEALVMSKTKLADAKAKLAGIKDVVPENSCENMTPELFEQIKLQAREAKDLLKESKNYLQNSIKELKTLRSVDDDSEDESENESTDDNGVDAPGTDSTDDNGTDTN